MRSRSAAGARAQTREQRGAVGGAAGARERDHAPEVARRLREESVLEERRLADAVAADDEHRLAAADRRERVDRRRARAQAGGDRLQLRLRRRRREERLTRPVGDLVVGSRPPVERRAERVDDAAAERRRRAERERLAAEQLELGARGWWWC